MILALTVPLNGSRVSNDRSKPLLLSLVEYKPKSDYSSMKTNLNLDWYDVTIKFARLAIVLVIGSLILSASKSIIF